MRLSDQQTISSLTYRFLVSLNPIAYSGIVLFDDEDVQCMINSYQQQYFSNVLEIYVEIVDAGCSSMPIHEPENVTQFSADTTWQPSTTCMGGPSMPPQSSAFDDQFTAQVNDDIGRPSDDDNEDDREAYIPDDGSSDTDVEGDFDGTGQPPSFLAPSPVNASFPVDQQNAQCEFYITIFFLCCVYSIILLLQLCCSLSVTLSYRCNTTLF